MSIKTINITLQLLDWSETKRGQKVIFEVMPDPDAAHFEHPFKDFTSRDGKNAGQYFYAVMAEYDPGSTAIAMATESSPLTPEEHKTLAAYFLTKAPTAATVPTAPLEVDPRTVDERTVSQRAYALCLDPLFQVWLCGPEVRELVQAQQAVRDELCKRCKVQSRAAFDASKAAEGRFNKLVEEFNASKVVKI